MVEEWVKNKTPIAINQGPSLREKSILLVKLMQYVEKRFSEDTELMAQFLELVNHVYRDEMLRNTELTAKLEPAFLAGLRCTQPPIRAKFFQVNYQFILYYLSCLNNIKSLYYIYPTLIAFLLHQYYYNTLVRIFSCVH